MKNSQQETYLKEKIRGLQNNPKRLFAEVINYILGRMISMQDEALPENKYWEKWAECNKGINLAVTHFNSETELGRKLVLYFLGIQKKLQEKPSPELFETLVEFLKTIKTGFSSSEVS